ncbi:MAG: type II toxin-antitoxin system Phd/YefM family antitoxin [Acidobacteria bacterium]|nr:type II toxin-antitoxin system Phd/YefM family antitoxin [Acidobacteriota bacterium]
MLDIKEDIQSLTDFKRNTAEYMQQLKQTGRPLVLTVNGKAELVVQDAASYQAAMQAAEDAKTLKALLAAKAGKGRPANEFFAELRKKYNLPEKRPRK